MPPFPNPVMASFMLFTSVHIHDIACALPEEVISSAELEQRLGPLYERLRLPTGRLELMTGIRERRVWPAGMLPSEASALAGQAVLERTGFDPARIGALFHCGVCRDCLEPATATAVHRRLGLSPEVLNFDMSNACLGVLSAMLTAGAMIDQGAIQAALVVTGEQSRPLLDATLQHLLHDPAITRQSSKNAFASLTIGSAAAAVLLTHASVAPGHRLLGGASLANTRFNDLCRGTADQGMDGGARPLMQTDSEELLLRGVETARDTWAAFKRKLGWNETTPDVVCTHQVGRIHRERLYQAIGIDPARDFSTIETLGNCGSASLPATVALAETAGRLRPGMRLAMLGIGSGINCTMLGLEW